MGTDNEAGADDAGAIGIHVAHDVFAHDLERAVVLVGDLRGVRLVGGRQFAVDVDAGGGHVGVDRHRRHERVVPDAVAQQLGHGPRVGGHVPARVDHGVPLPRSEGTEIVVAVDHEPLHAGIQVRVGLATVSHRHVVAPGQRRVDHVAAQEDGSADH